jgi:hypothetical protein
MRKIVFLAAVLVGCGGPATTGPSCVGQTAGLSVCIDFIGVTASEMGQLQSTCSTNFSGTWSTGPCSRVGVIGGCSYMVQSLEEITWFNSSSGLTSDQVRQSCVQANQNFVSP